MADVVTELVERLAAEEGHEPLEVAELFDEAIKQLDIRPGKRESDPVKRADLYRLFKLAIMVCGALAQQQMQLDDGQNPFEQH